MLVLGTLILTLTFLVTFMYSRFIKKRELLHPINVVSFFHILFNVPFAWFIIIDFDKYFPFRYVNSLQNIPYEQMFFNYAICHSIFFIFLILGIRFNLFRPFLFVNNIFPIIRSDNKFFIKIGVILSLVIGFISFYFFLKSNGGLFYILLNLHLRTSFTNGNGYILNGFGLIQISIFFFLFSLKGKRVNILNHLLITILTIIIFIAFSLLGGRKSSIFSLIYLFFAYHYFVKPITVSFFRVIIFSFSISIFMIFIPILRSKGGTENLLYNSNEFIEKIIDDGANILIGDLSYVPQYVFIVNYFNINNAWYGRSYLDILKAPIPRTLVRNKPPVDDGVYISHIINRKEYVIPSKPFEDLHPVSYPGETLGMGYANFLLPGVIIFGFLLGSIFSFFYSIMLKSNYAFIQTYLYIIAVMNIHISNLRIVNFLTLFLFNITFILIVFFLSIFWNNIYRRHHPQ